MLVKRSDLIEIIEELATSNDNLDCCPLCLEMCGQHTPTCKLYEVLNKLKTEKTIEVENSKDVEVATEDSTIIYGGYTLHKLQFVADGLLRISPPSCANSNTFVLGRLESFWEDLITKVESWKGDEDGQA